MEFPNKFDRNKGMTIPELVMATLMLTAFMGVFVVVSKFTANFIRPINLDGNLDFELAQEIDTSTNPMPDILNHHYKINLTIDSIISTLSQPGVSSKFIRNLELSDG